MDIYELLNIMIVIAVMVAFSVFAGRVEARLWKKCHRYENRLLLQGQITLGKSHCR